MTKDSKSYKLYCLIMNILALCALIYTIIVCIRHYNKDNLQNVMMCLLFWGFELVVIIFDKLRVKCSAFTVEIIIWFVFVHFVLGQALDFYIIIPFWDILLHIGNCVLLAMFACGATQNCTKSKFTLFTTFIYVVGFTVAIGVMWEFVEYSIDGIFGGNMQRWADVNTGLPFVGRDALKDTMKDLLNDFIGAIIAFTIHAICLVNHKNPFKNFYLYIDKKPKVQLEQPATANNTQNNMPIENIDSASSDNAANQTELSNNSSSSQDVVIDEDITKTDNT